MIIDYVIKHQNSYIFSHLFKSNLIKLINKGVKVSELLQSDIFEHKFDYELWPSTNVIGKKVQKHYNGSKYHLRDKYSEIF